MNSITVFCSASNLDEKYVNDAYELARLIALNKYELFWGGSYEGLMRTVADGVREGGGKIHGVSMEILRDVAMSDADEMVFAKDHAERKAIMIDRGDAIVILAGGIGTLDEAATVIELKKHGLVNKPIIFLDTDGFYEGLKTQLLRMKMEGFIQNELEDLVFFAKTPKDAIEYLQNPK